MTERFKKYLEEQFRQIPPTKGAMDFRKETLTTLEEYAQDAKIKGMVDEDAIYQLAIDSLGDFSATLAKFNDELTNRSKKNAMKLTSTALIVATVVIVLGLYLTLSLLNLVPWRMSWLIPLGSIFTAIVGTLTSISINIVRKKSYVIPRISLMVSIILTASFIFLVLLMLTRLPYIYFTFLAMVIAILVSDTIFAYATKSKLAFLESVATFIVSASLIYVMLGISRVMPWHPGWLLPALSLISGVAGVIVMLVHRSNKKKGPRVKKNAIKPTEVDEKYYTEW